VYPVILALKKIVDQFLCSNLIGPAHYIGRIFLSTPPPPALALAPSLVLGHINYLNQVNKARIKRRVIIQSCGIIYNASALRPAYTKVDQGSAFTQIFHIFCHLDEVLINYTAVHNAEMSIFLFWACARLTISSLYSVDDLVVSITCCTACQFLTYCTNYQPILIVYSLLFTRVITFLME
jgi:hypothetical protein